MPGRPAAVPALSRDRVLDAALQIADADGIGAVTMRSVAAALGVEAMSLYHHVPNKQALLDGLADLVVRTAELPDRPTSVADWVVGTAAGFRRLAQEHPRLLELLGTRAVPLHDPATARPFEAALAAFVRDGFDPAGAFAALQAGSVSILSMAQLEASSTIHLGQAAPDDLDHLDAATFPLLREIPRSGVGLDDFWHALTTALTRGLTPEAYTVR